jgi:glucose-1-phosphate thymidylyltransferase
MKGIILAGGTGSRLDPLTRVTNKHLLPVGNYPMIYHPIARLAAAGIKNIMVVTGLEHLEDIVGLLKNGSQWGLEFTYRVQQQAGGIAEALGLAENFAGGDEVVVILGDNVFGENISPYVENFKKQRSGARIMLKEVEHPERFGVPRLKGNKITEIIEKPSSPPSSYSVTGVYMYDPQVFEMIGGLDPSERGEPEITDVNNRYVESDQLQYDTFNSWWADAGTFPSYRAANRLTEDIRYELFE